MNESTHMIARHTQVLDQLQVSLIDINKQITVLRETKLDGDFFKIYTDQTAEKLRVLRNQIGDVNNQI